MQLSYCPPFIPYIARTLLSLPSTRFLHVFPPKLPCILHVVHVPRYLMNISLFYYSSYWGPVSETADERKSRIKILLLDCFLLRIQHELKSSCCVVLTGSQSDSTTILDILCSHYFFVDERPKYKICLILELNQLKHPSRNLASYSRVFPFPSSCSLLTYIFLIYSI